MFITTTCDTFLWKARVKIIDHYLSIFGYNSSVIQAIATR